MQAWNRRATRCCSWHVSAWARILDHNSSRTRSARARQKCRNLGELMWFCVRACAVYVRESMPLRNLPLASLVLVLVVLACAYMYKFICICGIIRIFTCRRIYRYSNSKILQTPLASKNEKFSTAFSLFHVVTLELAPQVGLSTFLSCCLSCISLKAFHQIQAFQFHPQ